MMYWHPSATWILSIRCCHRPSIGVHLVMRIRRRAALPSNASVKYLIHNAGMLGPIAPLTDIDRSTWHQIVATNLDAPLFLTQAFLPHLKRCANDDNSKTKARVLHMSSGAATSAYVGWGPYCVTKAGLQMMYHSSIGRVIEPWCIGGICAAWRCGHTHAGWDTRVWWSIRTFPNANKISQPTRDWQVGNTGQCCGVLSLIAFGDERWRVLCSRVGWQKMEEI